MVASEQLPSGPLDAPVSPKASYLEWATEGRSGWVWYLIGAVVLFVNLEFISQLFSGVAVIVGAMLGISLASPGGVLVITLLGFVWAFFTTPPIVAWLHRRPWYAVAMPTRTLDLAGFGWGALAMFATLTVFYLTSWLIDPSAWKFAGFNLVGWLPIAALGFVLLFMQAGAEEMFFRGYLAQFVRRFSSNPVLILLIPAIVFALPHYGNIDGVGGVLSLAPYIISGLAFGWLAYRTGSLWMPLGMHLINNWYLIALVGNPDDILPTVAPFLLGGGPATGPAWQAALGYTVSELVLDGITVLLLELFVIRRKNRKALTAATAA